MYVCSRVMLRGDARTKVMGQGISVGLRAFCVALTLCVGGAIASAQAQESQATTEAAPAPRAAAKTKPAKAKTAAKPAKATKATGTAAAPAEPTGPAQSILGALHLGTSEPDMPDFVRETRPQQLDYLPITSRGAEPDRPILTPDEIRRREADLEKLRSRHDHLAARAPAPAVKSAAPEPVAKKAKGAQGPCLLTCTIKARPDSMK